MKTATVLAVAALALALAACGGSSSDGGATAAAARTTTRTAMPAAPAMAGKSVVDVEDFAFTPATLTVEPGTTVTWKNADATNHTVTFSGGGAPPSVDDLAQGASASRTFMRAGTYRYVCTFHPNMKAEVVVAK